MKKTWNVIRVVLTWLVVAIAGCLMLFTIVSVLTLNQTQRNLFGLRASIVLSDSMKSTDFAAGDLVITKSVDCATLKPGDIISVVSRNDSSMGMVFTHKIRKLTTDANGKPGFVTYGTTTNTDDEVVVVYDDVLGKYCFRVPAAGHFFEFLKTTPGYVICILLPFSILILIQSIHSVRLFKRYKAEQNRAIKAERLKLQAEREQTRIMLEQLQQLRNGASVDLTPGKKVNSPTTSQDSHMTEDKKHADE